MVITKYNRGNGKYAIGSQASINSQKSNQTSISTTVSSADNVLWGNKNDGMEDIDATIYCNGSIYAMPQIYENIGDNDEDDEEYKEGELPEKKETEYKGFDDDEGGNIYAQNLIQSDKLYSKAIYLDYPKKIETKNPLKIDETNKTNLLELLKMLIPVGSIIMHNGSETKENLLKYGWAICDGSNGTPNLSDKFIKAVTSTSDVGTTGGSKTTALSIANLPSHNHTATTTTTTTITLNKNEDSVPSNCQNKYIPALDKIEEDYFYKSGSSNALLFTGERKGDNGLIGIKVPDLVSYAKDISSATAVSTSTTTIGNTGSGTTFTNEPQFYSLLYIMRIS